MNDLKSRLTALNEKPEVKPCPFAALMATFDNDTAEVLQKLVDNPKIAIRAIHEELQTEGIKIARESISNHRKGWCRCKGTTE